MWPSPGPRNLHQLSARAKQRERRHRVVVGYLMTDYDRVGRTRETCDKLSFMEISWGSKTPPRKMRDAGEEGKGRPDCAPQHLPYTRGTAHSGKTAGILSFFPMRRRSQDSAGSKGELARPHRQRAAAGSEEQGGSPMHTRSQQTRSSSGVSDSAAGTDDTASSGGGARRMLHDFTVVALAQTEQAPAGSAAQPC